MSLSSPLSFPFIYSSTLHYVSHIFCLSPGLKSFTTESLTKWDDIVIIGFQAAYYLYAMNRWERTSRSTGYMVHMRRILKVPGSNLDQGTGRPDGTT
jgi:hypothetical protein